MTLPVYFDSKKSLNLLGLNQNFDFLKNLFITNKLPKALMLSGKKGSGKSTIINHLMYYIFDEENYNLEKYELNSNTSFYNQFLNNIHPNIIYLSGSDFKNVKIEDIRNLKSKIFQTSISEKPRFIILDDIELFNINSLNALLKIIEEPSKNNYFILINNKSRPLLETIKSRCLEIKIILNEKKRLNIIGSLIKKFGINYTLDPETSHLSPGYFIKFNYFFDQHKINPNKDYLKNLTIILNLYKKTKEIIFIDMILFLTNVYFNNVKNKNFMSNEKILENKNFIFDNINKFFLYNLNQNGLLNSINYKINNE
jgi:DNA polymerase III subunit delta'